jgi:hypothetical protein
VNGALAIPLAFVTTLIVAVLLLNFPLAPEPGAVNVTVTPETGLFETSFTVTASGLANAVLIAVDCGVVPALAVMEVAALAVLVSLKLLVMDPAVTLMLYGPPAVPLAVNTLAAATPLALVFAVVVRVLVEAKVPLAPTAGAVKVTDAPLMAWLPASRTVTDRFVGNAVEIDVDWLLPDVRLMVAGTCTTVTVLNPVAPVPWFVWIRSPPPHAVAVFVIEVAEAAGTLTFSVIVWKLAWPATTAVDVQTATVVVDEEQLQFAPVTTEEIV